MNKKELLGKRIKELRKKNNLTQEYLAEKLNIETRQLSKLETGKHYPSFETIIGLIETFNITFEELVNFDHLDEINILKKDMIDLINNFDEKKLSLAYRLIKCLKN